MAASLAELNGVLHVCGGFNGREARIEAKKNGDFKPFKQDELGFEAFKRKKNVEAFNQGFGIIEMWI